MIYKMKFENKYCTPHLGKKVNNTCQISVNIFTFCTTK